ncbi:MAG: radical SAM protein [Rugosibacter sp.]
MKRQPRILLTTEDHSRDSAGMHYVYPVLSRRAGGISVGINLNPNNACNWRCIYCQVPNLTRGGPPPIDLALLEHELATLLDTIHSGQLIINHVSPDVRTVVDVAFSGNGEPTSAAEFPAAVAIAQKVLAARGLADRVKLRLITNGSLLDRRTVQQGIALLGEASGEVWFKLDTASPAGLAQINGTRTSPQAVVRRLARCATLAPTWVQTCFFLLDKQPPAETEITAYLALLAPLAAQLEGVHLYGLARPSLQKEASRLGRMAASDLESIAQRIRQIGLRVHVSP